MSLPANIAVLGSTGSIGCQTLEVIAAHPSLFKAHTLIAGSNVELLARQAIEHRPAKVVIACAEKYEPLKDALRGRGIKIAAGADAVVEAVAQPQIDMLLNAAVGYSGLEPTLNAIAHGKDIALANKETLVVAGELVMEAARKNGVKIYPVDSEHSAIYQCLAGEDPASIYRLILTASGGPFRDMEAASLKTVTARQALKHPNWQMGAKITIDSATLMNKAFEIIEARWLFDMPAHKIVAWVHPQSIVHSMVEFVDGAIKAQLGLPDMKLPIKYALARGKRLPENTELQRLTIERMSNLTFAEPDRKRFPCLDYADIANTRGGNTACVINAANEVAVAAFLKEKIGFTDIPRLIDRALAAIEYVAAPTLQDYITTNAEARQFVASLIAKQK